MLSNFQLGNQSLLQSFLVGQPEFRAILRRPEMEQFRQRVAATCHIGPLDAAETRGYIEHRLKCAGSRGQPSFDDEVFEEIFEASQGIPRRINSVCDRLLMLGFIDNRSRLTATDVGEVVAEFKQEAAAPVPAPESPVLNGASADALRGVSEAVDPLDIDVSKARLGAELAGKLSRELGDLSAQHQGDRLQRLEQSLLRLEHINLQTLSMLQSLVSALKNSGEEN